MTEILTIISFILIIIGIIFVPMLIGILLLILLGGVLFYVILMLLYEFWDWVGDIIGW